MNFLCIPESRKPANRRKLLGLLDSPSPRCSMVATAKAQNSSHAANRFANSRVRLEKIADDFREIELDLEDLVAIDPLRFRTVRTKDSS